VCGACILAKGQFGNMQVKPFYADVRVFEAKPMKTQQEEIDNF
jgi:hypothetical protein